MQNINKILFKKLKIKKYIQKYIQKKLKKNIYIYTKPDKVKEFKKHRKNQEK